MDLGNDGLIYLVTQPMEIPVRASHNHQSKVKDLEETVSI